MIDGIMLCATELAEILEQMLVMFPNHHFSNKKHCT